jgi:hypothetical protein
MNSRIMDQSDIYIAELHERDSSFGLVAAWKGSSCRAVDNFETGVEE